MASSDDAGSVPDRIEVERPQATPAQPTSGARTMVLGAGGRIARIKELNIFLALLVLCIFLSTQSDVFLTSNNLLGVARAFSLTAIVAIGQTMVILTGGIDLSVGSVLAFSGITTAMLLAGGSPLALAMAGGFLVGMGFGLANGLLITKVGLPPFIATLGMLSVGRGLVYVLTNATPITVSRDHAFLIQLGQGYVGVVPVPVIIMVIVTIVATIFLTQSTLGRYIYAVGGNEEAARLAGINVTLVKITVYVISSTLAALAGMILVARLISAQPSAGLGFELPVIAASIIGGTSLMGGEGTVLGAVLGAAIMGILDNGMVLLGVNVYAQQAVIGSVILLAVSIDMWQKRRRLRQ